MVCTWAVQINIPWSRILLSYFLQHLSTTVMVRLMRVLLKDIALCYSVIAQIMANYSQHMYPEIVLLLQTLLDRITIVMPVRNRT